MKPMSLTSPESIAREYKGNKKAIANAARMGLVDPTAALMAGMFIDRMRNAASEEQKTDTTVVQDTFGIPAAPQQPPQGMPQPQQAAPQPQMAQMPQPQGIPGAQMAAAQPRMAPGVEGLPTGDVGNYAGGGIVAFADRGLVDGDELENYMGQLYPGSTEEIFARYQNNPEYLNSVLEEEAAKKQRIEEARNYNARINAEFFRNNPQFASSVDFRPVSPSVPVSNVNSAPSAKAAPNADIDFNSLPLKDKIYVTRELLKNQEADKEKLRGKVRDTIGLPAIMKGPNLTTPFNRAAPEAATTRSDLPPSVAARPEAPAPAPRVDAYGLPVPDPTANLALARQQAESLVSIPKRVSQEDMIASENKLRKDLGVNENLPAEQREKLEEERRGLKADKEEAKWSRLIEAGLGVMAGTSPFASVNIGQGASPALKGFAQDIKDVKKADRELNRAQMALETTENQYKIDKSRAVQSRMDKQEENVMKAEQTRATAAASLGASINTVTTSMYDARLRDLTARATSENQREASMYSADQGLRGSLANAAATRFGYGRDEASIERIMAEQGVGYTEAMGIHAQQKARANDRYNSIRNSVNRVEENIREDLSIRTMRGQLAEAEKDPVANAAKITKLKQNINDAKDKYYTDAGISKDTRDYLAEEDKRILNQTRGRTNFDKDGKSSAPPTKPAQLPAGTPKGATYGAYVQGKGWEIKDGDGKLIGYGQ
jgi:hypothetical protein